MSKSSIPVFTLKDIIEANSTQLFDENVAVFDILQRESVDEIELNYPCKVDFMGILLVTEGEAIIKVDFEQMKLKPMDLVSIFPNNVVEFIAISNDCTLKAASVSYNYMAELHFNIDSSEALQLFSNTYSNFIRLDEEIYQAVLYHMARIAEVNTQKSMMPFMRELIKSHITLMTYELASFKQFYERKYVFKSSRKEEMAVRFIGLIARDFRQHREVQYYADQMHISRKHLTRSVKEVYDLTPKQIIDKKIIGEAKVLLQKTELTISEVMQELNFDDQAAFSKFFKNNTGLSPLSYRKQILK